MSADNGIYILKTKVRPGRTLVGGIQPEFEYRVAHVVGIDNMYYDIESGEYHYDHFTPEEAYHYFQGPNLFFSEGAAISFAHELAGKYDILEYGVCCLDFPEQQFVEFTKEQLEAYHNECKAKIERYHRERDAERLRKLQAATVSIFDDGTVFEITGASGVYGFLVRPDGSRVHGSLSGLKEISLRSKPGIQQGEFVSVAETTEAEGVTFLPSDWAD